ncbi:MAG: exodeoxyribonuclease VII large subunit, partial [Bacteroidota bacterium]|nr:exodeoxyribonuclease VII large subunit [Bacteroidota bacterium]
YRMLKPYFESTTGHQLAAGIKVLLNVTVEFHEVYGFSLNVRDIDPTYTLGDLARKRAEIIARLEREGVLTMNKELPMPLIPKNIAVISSPTAAGLGDFMDQLDKNPYKYRFYTRLFPALMQGAGAEASIISALEQIYELEELFDVVVLIRGGGASVDLNCFDSYELAYHITQFPLPVITGIGHEKDDTIVDLVAHTRVKTPTAAAEFILNRMHSFSSSIDELGTRFVKVVKNRLALERMSVGRMSAQFRPMVKGAIQKKKHMIQNQETACVSLIKSYLVHGKNRLHRCSSSLNHLALKSIAKKDHLLDSQQVRLSLFCKNYLNSTRRELDNYEKTNMLVSPENILKRGYSITLANGYLIKSVAQVEAGATLRTLLSDGEIISTVDHSTQR